MSNYHYAIGSHLTNALSMGKRRWEDLDGKTFESKEQLAHVLAGKCDLAGDGWSRIWVEALAEDLFSLGMPLKIVGDWTPPEGYGQYVLIKPKISFDDYAGTCLADHLFGG